MIYLFTWNNDFLIREKTKKWKDLFVEKHWDFNLVHIKDIEEVDGNFLSENLLAQSFFTGKKLIIIDWVPASANNKSKTISEKQEYLMTIFDKIPDDNIVLFSASSPDKRSKFYKSLIKIADKVEEFNTASDDDVVRHLSKTYNWKVSRWAINTLVRYKWGNMEKSMRELDKLLITEDFIEETSIEKYISPELEESIFTTIDHLMNLRSKELFEWIDIILENTNMYLFYNSLLANLRVNMYIYHLKNQWISDMRIGNILNLWRRSFLVGKRYKIKFDKLNNLYINLIKNRTPDNFITIILRNMFRAQSLLPFDSNSHVILDETLLDESSISIPWR